MEYNNIEESNDQIYGDIADIMLGMEPQWDITAQTSEIDITAISQNPPEEGVTAESTFFALRKVGLESCLLRAPRDLETLVASGDPSVV